jgi:hypothetical protein
MSRMPTLALSACLTTVVAAVAVDGLQGQTARRRAGHRAAGIRTNSELPSAERVTVEMRLATERGLSPLQVQQWVQVLEPLDIRPLSIGVSDGRGELDVQEERSAGGRHLVVQGRIDARSRLLVPEHRFTLSDHAAIGAWIDELKRYGPRGSPQGKPLWGLSEAEFRRLYTQLGRPMGRSFRETPLAEVLDYCRRVSGVDVAGDPATLNPSGRDSFSGPATRPPRVASGPLVTLPDTGLSVGTALAFLLSQHDRAFRVEPTRDGPPRLVVLSRTACRDPWPVGWPTPKPPSQLAPTLMKFTPVELINAPANQVLDAVEANVDVPFLYDRAALARRRIDLTKVPVNYVRKSSFWKNILDRAASLARLRAELKTDEAGKPFVWITVSSTRFTPPAPRRLQSAQPPQNRERHDATQESKR